MFLQCVGFSGLTVGVRADTCVEGLAKPRIPWTAATESGYGRTTRARDWPRGIFASMRLLWPQILSINLMEQAPELRVPGCFLEGRHDYEAPSALVEQYYEAVRAPSKTLVWFENSAHFVNTEESDAFNRFLVDRLRVETHR